MDDKLIAAHMQSVAAMDPHKKVQSDVCLCPPSSYSGPDFTDAPTIRAKLLPVMKNWDSKTQEQERARQEKSRVNPKLAGKKVCIWIKDNKPVKWDERWQSESSYAHEVEGAMLVVASYDTRGMEQVDVYFSDRDYVWLGCMGGVLRPHPMILVQMHGDGPEFLPY